MKLYIVSLSVFAASISGWALYPHELTVYAIVLFGWCFIGASTYTLYHTIQDAYTVVAPIRTPLAAIDIINTYEDEAAKTGADAANVIQHVTIEVDNGNSYEVTIKRLNSDRGIKELINL